jgi:hypothetical protein
MSYEISRIVGLRRSPRSFRAWMTEKIDADGLHVFVNQGIRVRIGTTH